jgi:hypothetical protein
MNPKNHIPHPEAERGRANALLLFILAFTAVSFTLVAGTNPGQKYRSISKDNQCTFGKTENSTDKAGKVISCQRPYLSMQKCKDCEPTDDPEKCDCKQTCVPNGSWQTGVYLAPNVTITFTNTLNGGGKLEATWDKYISATINKDGKTAYVYTVTGKGDPQCLYPPK